MKRVIAVLVASFAAFLGLLQPAEATMESAAVVAQTYTYNSQHDAAAFAYAATERGPPSRYDRRTSHSVTDPWSVGASTRSQAGASCAITTNDAHRTLVQVARATSTTWEQARVADGEFLAVDRVGVAANTAKPAIGFAEGLGETALTPGRLQHASKNLMNAGLLPSWSGKSSPGIIKRAFTPILERPSATFDHTLGGTRVRGFLGEIDGQQAALFVYKEGPYQGQLASSSIPSTNQLKMWGLAP